MLTAGISNNKVKYSRLAADDDGYIDLQVRDFVDWWQNVKNISPPPAVICYELLSNDSV